MGLFSNMIMGKGNRPDFTPDMMPKNRFQLFFEMLKLNLFNLVKVNLLYLLFWIPFWAWTAMNLMLFTQGEMTFDNFYNNGYFAMYLYIAAALSIITGPAKAALKYITRNYSQDQHVWIWSDFKDAFKTNWKQGLAMSTLNAVFVVLFVFGIIFYTQMAGSTGSLIYLVLQVLLCVFAGVFFMTNLYVWPMMVTYDLKFGQLMRNSLILAIGRLPQSLLFAVLTALPMVISYLVPFCTIWYFIIGYSLAAFINCSYTNSVFDKFFNSRIEGAETGKGMQKPEEDEDEWEDLDPDLEDKK